MLFHTLLSPGTDNYFNQLAWTFHGSVDESVLQRAWQSVVDRHTSARTAFLWKQHTEPLQVVVPQAELPWRVLDWTSVSAEECEEGLEALLVRERALGFDLSCPPLMRVTLVRLPEGALRVIWNFHHLVLDGWSVGLFLQELFATHEALAAGTPRPAAPTPPYREYIAWLRRQDTVRTESFWRERLAGFGAPTPLPMDQAPLRSATGPQQELTLSLTAPETAALNHFAREHQLTLGTLLHASWALVLARYSGNEDVVFGSTVAGRPPELEGAESTIGLFINTLPVRARVSGEASVRTWLRRFQESLAEQRPHEHAALVQVQSWSELPRGTPLFESLLVVESYPVDASVHQSARHLDVRSLETFDQTSYPLTANVFPGDALRFLLQYDPQRFEAEAMQRLLGHWKTALASLISSAEQRLFEVSLMDEQERNQVVVEWNDTHLALPFEPCFPQLFEQQAARTPDTLAASCDDQARPTRYAPGTAASARS